MKNKNGDFASDPVIWVWKKGSYKWYLKGKPIQLLAKQRGKRRFWPIILESYWVQGENMESNRRKPLMVK